MTDPAVLHHFRQFRSLHGEPFGRPAASALQSARSFVAFRKRLADDVAQSKRRSKAAKRGWKTRKASL